MNWRLVGGTDKKIHMKMKQKRGRKAGRKEVKYITYHIPGLRRVSTGPKSTRVTNVSTPRGYPKSLRSTGSIDTSQAGLPEEKNMQKLGMP